MKDDSIVLLDEVQSLWSGYGQLLRVKSKNNNKTYIVKAINPNQASDHPRGWNTSASHQRKLKSYQVEAAFYREYAAITDLQCKVPYMLAFTEWDNCFLLVMEDLNALGYSMRKETADWYTLNSALQWLAWFHGRFMHTSNEGLWRIGTYWHLDTRRDEWRAMPVGRFKVYAKDIDIALNSADFKALLHGDAKLANLCFHEDGEQVAGVDFQYVGPGSVVKDLAYLAGSALTNNELFKFGELIVDTYLEHLEQALAYYQPSLNFLLLEHEVRKLYPVAWADFYRFLLGWNPNSWKVCDYMKKMAEKGLKVALS